MRPRRVLNDAIDCARGIAATLAIICAGAASGAEDGGALPAPIRESLARYGEAMQSHSVSATWGRESGFTAHQLAQMLDLAQFPGSFLRKRYRDVARWEPDSSVLRRRLIEPDDKVLRLWQRVGNERTQVTAPLVGRGDAAIGDFDTAYDSVILKWSADGEWRTGQRALNFSASLPEIARGLGLFVPYRARDFLSGAAIQSAVLRDVERFGLAGDIRVEGVVEGGDDRATDGNIVIPTWEREYHVVVAHEMDLEAHVAELNNGLNSREFIRQEIDHVRKLKAESPERRIDYVLDPDRGYMVSKAVRYTTDGFVRQEMNVVDARRVDGVWLPVRVRVDVHEYITGARIPVLDSVSERVPLYSVVYRFEHGGDVAFFSAESEGDVAHVGSVVRDEARGSYLLPAGEDALREQAEAFLAAGGVSSGRAGGEFAAPLLMTAAAVVVVGSALCIGWWSRSSGRSNGRSGGRAIGKASVGTCVGVGAAAVVGSSEQALATGDVKAFFDDLTSWVVEYEVSTSTGDDIYRRIAQKKGVGFTHYSAKRHDGAFASEDPWRQQWVVYNNTEYHQFVADGLVTWTAHAGGPVHMPESYSKELWLYCSGLWTGDMVAPPTFPGGEPLILRDILAKHAIRSDCTEDVLANWPGCVVVEQPLVIDGDPHVDRVYLSPEVEPPVVKRVLRSVSGNGADYAITRSTEPGEFQYEVTLGDEVRAQLVVHTAEVNASVPDVTFLPLRAEDTVFIERSSGARSRVESSGARFRDVLAQAAVLQRKFTDARSETGPRWVRSGAVAIIIVNISIGLVVVHQVYRSRRWGA